MISRKQLFIGAIGFQIVAILILAIPPILALTGGKTINVRSEPVDPTDMFRGDYVRLAYSFSNVPTTETFTYHTKVFVRLHQDADKQWQAIGVSKTKPPIAADEILLFGETEYADEEAKKVHINYGIEQVYVPEGRGKDLSSANRLDLELAVPGNGRAVIKRAQHNNDILYQWKWI